MPEIYISAREMRKAMLLELEQQQRADSGAAIEMRNCILANTRKLLLGLSALLETYSQKENVSQADRDLFSAIAGSVPLNEWLEYREDHTTLERKAELLRDELTEAETAYHEVAPLGRFSKIFMNENEKRIVDALKANRDKIDRTLLALDAGIRRVEGCLQEKAEKFFNEAMTKESLEHLSKADHRVADRIKRTLAKMSEEIQELVKSHSVAQSQSLAKVQKNVTALFDLYKTNEQ